MQDTGDVIGTVVVVTGGSVVAVTTTGTVVVGTVTGTATQTFVLQV
jgi:hypothetical protein